MNKKEAGYDNNSIQVSLFRGRGNSIVIDDIFKTIEENGFLTEVYKRAGSALESYLKQVDRVMEELKSSSNNISEVNDILYRAPQNIIAFSGERGSGKTSVMLSFAHALTIPVPKNPPEQFEILNSHRFAVLNPIDPTMLEGRQNIISVVLSRLMFKAQEIWEEYFGNSQNGFPSLEEEKNKIIFKARECLTEINAVKESEKVKTLDQLQKSGDSAILKKNLLELVKRLTDFCFPGQYKDKTDILIIPIDDTDCQFRKAYEVMEDIRRYLTLPNVVILMATDLKMLDNIFKREFKEAYNAGPAGVVIDDFQVEKVSAKYLAKMIPPVDRIYLPVIDDFIKKGYNAINLRYYDTAGINILDNKEGFQSKILSYVYKKTHLFFAEHKSYSNNLIPRTLRGLSQFLDLMSTLKDVREIDISEFADREQAVEVLKEQDFVLEENLDVFESYFFQDWMLAKINDEEMRAIIQGIADQVPEDRISYIYYQLGNSYNLENQLGNRPTYYDLDKRMRQILWTTDREDDSDEYYYGSYKEIKDYYNIFAIRTVLAILNTRDTVKARREFFENSKADEEFINYKQKCLSLPNRYYLNWQEFPSFDKLPEPGNYLYQSDEELLSEALLSGFYRMVEGEFDYQNTQLEVNYVQQELAVLISCNWEAQDQIRKAIKKNNKSGKAYKDLGQSVEELYLEILQQLGKINDGMLKDKVEFVIKRCREGKPQESKQQEDQRQGSENKESGYKIMRYDLAVETLKRIATREAHTAKTLEMERIIEDMPEAVLTDESGIREFKSDLADLKKIIQEIEETVDADAKNKDITSRMVDNIQRIIGQIDSNEEIKEEDYQRLLKNLKNYLRSESVRYAVG